jgi:excisionase family DNA binding protein
MERAPKAEHMVADRLLTANEAAAQLRVGVGAIRDWLRSGELRGMRMRSTRAGWRIRESDLARFIEAQMNQPSAD